MLNYADNQFYMQTSQNMAKYQGLKTAGKDIELKISWGLCFDCDG